MKLNGRVEFAKSNVNAWDIGPTVEKHNSDTTTTTRPPELR